MCGIVGYIGKNKDENYIKNSLSTILHRGGEMEKTIIDENYFLGFTRLAINDLNDKSTAPFSKEDVLVVCNGEIYNCKELENDLIQHKMQTRNDTEIIINLYLEFNRNITKVLEKIKGMYSIALIDTRKKRAYLVRDQIGIKPLYYCNYNNNIYFSSEIKSFKYIENFSFNPNMEQLFRILCYRSTSNNTTAFKDIHKVAPANYVDISFPINSISKFKYWNFPDYNPKSIDAQHIKKTVTKVINEHSLSDVKLSTTLSGGLDSSIISSVIKKTREDILTFSSMYNVEGDETEKFEMVRDFLNVNNKKVVVKKEDFLGLLDSLIWYMDEPFADPAVIPLFLLSKEIATNKIKVTIMGEGADEVFLGYDKYREAFDNTTFSFVDFIEKRAPFKMNQLEEMNNDLYKKFQSEMSEIIKEYNFDTDLPKDVILNNLSRFDIEKMLPNLQLMRADKSTMANTVEARVPFLHLDIIDLVQNINAKDEFSDTNEKVLLRNAFVGELPNDIIYGQKQIFFVPLDYLIDKEIKRKMINIIKKSKIIFDLVQVNDIDLFLEDLNSYQTWILYMISIWENKFIRGDSDD